MFRLEDASLPERREQAYERCRRPDCQVVVRLPDEAEVDRIPQLDPRGPRRLHGRVDLCFAEAADEDVRGGVVADGHHQDRQVAERELQAIVHIGEEARAEGAVARGILPALADRQLAGLRLAVELDQYGDLDGAGGGEALPGVDGEFFAAAQVAGSDSETAAEVLAELGQAAQDLSAVFRHDGSS